MNSEKIAYWVALAVFAVGVSHEYREGSFSAVHQVVAKAETTLCHIASRAEQTIVMASLIVNPAVSQASHNALAAPADLASEQIEMAGDRARDQAEMVRQQVQAQAEILQAQAELRRLQSEPMLRLQIEQLRHSQLRFSHAADRHLTLICPKTGAKIAVNVNPPDVEVTDNF